MNAAPDRAAADRPVVIVTGAAGGVGSALIAALRENYRVVALDRQPAEAAARSFVCDISDDGSVRQALREFRAEFGARIASVVHLAAYFDFTGEDNPLYERVNVDGTRRLLCFLQDFDVGQFVYSGTMLVHAPCKPGEYIDETAPIEPKWAYPRSKARAEEVIRRERGRIPAVLLHIAGVYDQNTVVPTLAQQIARIYERNVKSRLYTGDLAAGQSMVHSDDLVDAMVRAIGRRHELPEEVVLLIGEREAVGYGELQDRIGGLIHGEARWRTRTMPKRIAATGAWLQEKAEPIVPDALDQGEKPFIRGFMIAMADDYYALDTSRAEKLLGWQARHRLDAELPAIVAALKRDPVAWYRANKVTLPPWLEAAAQAREHPETLRAGYELEYRRMHGQWRWAAMLNVGLGAWLMASAGALGYAGRPEGWNELICGIAIVLLAGGTLSWRFGFGRWLLAGIGVWLLVAPLVFWTPAAAAYLNGTLIGALVFACALVAPPEAGVGPVADRTGPIVPPGWDYSPSDWTQRLPIIALALVGLLISRHLAAYQLGHIDGAWDPFFDVAGPRNGTESIITSTVAEAWPVSDAGLGATVYMLEILLGAFGSARRWRTAPWSVALFGLLVVPLGIVSITFIIIQPIVLGTWCTLCLIGAAAMLLQIPYALDELVATAQFLRRRRRAGRPLFLVFFAGDTDEVDKPPEAEDPFDRPPGEILREALTRGVSLPWNLALCLSIGVWLMCTRLTLGSEGAMADVEHLVGALAITVTVPALADVARPVRLLNVPLGAALVIAPFIVGAAGLSVVASLVAGLALIVFSLPRGIPAGRESEP